MISPDGRHGAPPVLAALVSAAAIVLLVAGCGFAAPSEVAPSEAAALPAQSLSPELTLTRATVEAALRAADLGLVEPRVPFRPPESSALLDLPRAVFQVVLSDDPTGGFLVIYQAPTPDAAHAAGVAQAAWLSSGPGSVQSVLGTAHVIRQLGSTLVTFSYPPTDAPDARAPKVAAALASVGLAIPIGP